MEVYGATFIIALLLWTAVAGAPPTVVGDAPTTAAAVDHDAVKKDNADKPPLIFPEDDREYKIKMGGDAKQSSSLFKPPLEFPNDTSKYKIVFTKPEPPPPLVFPDGSAKSYDGTIVRGLTHGANPKVNPKLETEMYQGAGAFVEKDAAKGGDTAAVRLHGQIGSWLAGGLFAAVLVAAAAYVGLLLWRRSHGSIRRRILINEDDFQGEVKYSEC